MDDNKDHPNPPQKGKLLENGLDFLIFFAIYYHMVLNDDKLWQAQKELKL